MVLLYNLGLLLYGLVVFLVSPFNPKAKKWIKGRRKWAGRLKQTVSGHERIAWFHCSSLGEFEQGRTVIEGFRNRYPDYKILITFFSPSGYEVHKSYAGADWVFYLPLDTYFSARKFIRIVNPSIAIFVKYEFWYHYLSRLKRANIDTYIISAIFRPKQVFFRWYGGFFRRMLNTYKHLFVQNEESRKLLSNLNITNVSIAGDTRFDRVFALAQQAMKIPIIERFVSGKPVIIAGSSWADDEALIAKYLEVRKDLQLIVAPHEVEESNIRRLVQLFSGKKVIRYTQADKDMLLNDYDVLIIDTIGLLMSAYRYGTIAYIGGGFTPSGIHNTLEAATFGLPVIFGPTYDKFQEAKDLIANGGGFSINGQEQLNAILNQLLNDSDYCSSCGNMSKQYVDSKRGATKTILDSIAVKA